MTEQSPPTPSRPDWDAVGYDERFSFVPRYGLDVLELLAPQPGERILDLGSGTGHLAAQIAERGATVVGVDVSPEMIARARERYPALDFREADASDLPFVAEFDAVFSNATLHWVKAAAHPVVAAAIHRALKPGGRFVAEFGGKGNVQHIAAALASALAVTGFRPEQDPNPWYYPSIGEYASLLEATGLEVEQAMLFDRPTPLDIGEDAMRAWIAMFGSDFLAHVPDDARDRVLAEVERQLRPHLYVDGRWRVDYRRLRIVARKTGERPG